MASAQTPEEFICSHCGKTYKHKRNLTVHERTHSGTETFRCCGIGFSSNRRLIRHRCSAHGDTKSHVCVNCGKEFSTNDDLVRHQESERGEKKLSCDMCGHKFLQKYALKEHMSSHSEEKTHQCRQCGITYKHVSSLSRHMRYKHAEA